MGNSEPENQSRFEILPVEVISIISSYLNVGDILECCATNSIMRELFSDDFIWKPRCNKQLAYYLKKIPCKVNPSFNETQNKKSSLSPLPEWRMSYMRENQLWDNWREGRFLEDSLNTTESSLIFYNNDCVVAKYHDRIELLDVTLIPASKIITINLEMSPNFDVELANDLIVILDKSRVQVFRLDLDNKTAERKHLFYFETSDKSTVNELSANSNVSQVLEEISRVTRVVVGNYFVGVLPEERTLHIWNLSNGVKLKEEVVFHPELEQCSVLQMEASSNNHVMLTVGIIGQETKTFIAYSLTELKFLSFSKTYDMNSVYKVYKNMVMIMFRNTVAVFNYINSQILVTVRSECFPKVIKDNLWFIHDGKFLLFNFITNTMQPMTDIAKSLKLDERASFDVIGDKFLLPKSWSFHLFGGVVWEIDEKNVYLRKTVSCNRFDCDESSLNTACTRCISSRRNIRSILHFW